MSGTYSTDIHIETVVRVRTPRRKKSQDVETLVVPQPKRSRVAPEPLRQAVWLLRHVNMGAEKKATGSQDMWPSRVYSQLCEAVVLTMLT